MRFPLLCMPLLLLLGSCSSPPKPPTVDPSQKRPANAAVAVEAQTCRSELQNTRIIATENARAARASSDTATRLALQMRALSMREACPAAPRNAVYSILFGFGSTKLAVPAGDLSRLVDEARTAPLIVLSGRTDGAMESPAEGRIARERAATVQAYLVAAGIAPARIRITWQPIGDHAADNASSTGRALNRRVEIEIYQAAPRFASLSAALPS